MKITAVCMMLMFLCFLSGNAQTSETGRWFSDKQVNDGKTLFANNCASCHGSDASSTPEWRKRDAKGNFPPPPLNGTAHTWHHPMNILQFTILKGGAPVGGVMPAFETKLNLDQVNSIIAWFQSLWPDNVYDIWNGRHPGGAYKPD